MSYNYPLFPTNEKEAAEYTYLLDQFNGDMEAAQRFLNARILSIARSADNLDTPEFFRAVEKLSTQPIEYTTSTGEKAWTRPADWGLTNAITETYYHAAASAIEDSEKNNGTFGAYARGIILPVAHLYNHVWNFVHPEATRINNEAARGMFADLHMFFEDLAREDHADSVFSVIRENHPVATFLGEMTTYITVGAAEAELEVGVVALGGKVNKLLKAGDMLAELAKVKEGAGLWSRFGGGIARFITNSKIGGLVSFFGKHGISMSVDLLMIKDPTAVDYAMVLGGYGLGHLLAGRSVVNRAAKKSADALGKKLGLGTEEAAEQVEKNSNLAAGLMEQVFDKFAALLHLSGDEAEQVATDLRAAIEQGKTPTAALDDLLEKITTLATRAGADEDTITLALDDEALAFVEEALTLMAEKHDSPGVILEHLLNVRVARKANGGIVGQHAATELEKTFHVAMSFVLKEGGAFPGAEFTDKIIETPTGKMLGEIVKALIERMKDAGATARDLEMVGKHASDGNTAVLAEIWAKHTFKGEICDTATQDRTKFLLAPLTKILGFILNSRTTNLWVLIGKAGEKLGFSPETLKAIGVFTKEQRATLQSLFAELHLLQKLAESGTLTKPAEKRAGDLALKTARELFPIRALLWLKGIHPSMLPEAAFEHAVIRAHLATLRETIANGSAEDLLRVRGAVIVHTGVDLPENASREQMLAAIDGTVTRFRNRILDLDAQLEQEAAEVINRLKNAKTDTTTGEAASTASKTTEEAEKAATPAPEPPPASETPPPAETPEPPPVEEKPPVEEPPPSPEQRRSEAVEALLDLSRRATPELRIETALEHLLPPERHDPDMVDKVLNYFVTTGAGGRWQPGDIPTIIDDLKRLSPQELVELIDTHLPEILSA